MTITDKHAGRFTIIESYPVWQGLQLHSLASPVTYHCPECRSTRESALVATTHDHALCPPCYAARLS